MNLAGMREYNLTILGIQITALEELFYMSSQDIAIITLSLPKNTNY
jgi:hypothetical protein